MQGLRTLRRSDGSMDDPNGSTNTTGSVSLNTEFDNSQMRIVVGLNSARFQTALDYGNGILILDFDDIGNVSCTVEGGNGPSEFRVYGNRGSAYVTVKQGQDPKAVKDAVQKALDGF